MSYQRDPNLPSFEMPPVHEVAVGIGFRRLQCWTSVAPGEFRALIKDDYPNVEEKLPLAPLPPILGAEQQVELSELPPIRRTWFLSEDEQTLLQLQEDRMHVNWRKTQDQDVYPRYGHVFKKFEQALSILAGFVSDREDQLEATAGEVTYVNHIVEGDLWSNLNDLTSVFKDWAPAPRQSNAVASIVSSVALKPSDTGIVVSPDHYMTLELKTGERVRDQKKVLVVQLVNRGPLNTTDVDVVREWCGRASEDIVKTFAALTSERAHTLWRRLK